MSETILVDDVLIDKYRARFELNARAWQDPIVRGYVLALSTRLTIALMAGWQDTVTDITATLARFEPLEAIREHDYGGHVLWIGYNWHVVRDTETTRAAIEAALRMWPGDNRLVRMRAVTTPAARPPQAIPFPAPASASHVSFGDTGMTPVVPPSA